MTNEIQTYHLILAAFLGSLGTLITNFIWDRIKENTKKGILLVGLASEIKVIREDLSGQLLMMRKDLKNDSQTRPDGLEFPSVIFTANAGSLGLFGDGDFVDHLVETYSSLNSLITHSHSFQRFTNDQICREQVCDFRSFTSN